MPEHFEPERYELAEPPAYAFTPTRREFLEVLGAGLLITVMGADAQTVDARLHVGDDGVVTVMTGKVEVGQGARTEIAMAVAEEMRIPLDRVRVVMADTDVVPNDGITAGSRTTPSTLPAVRKAAAAARTKSAGGDVQLTPVEQWKVLGTSMFRTDGREMVTGAHLFPSDIVRPGMLYGCVLRAPAYNAMLQDVDTGGVSKNVVAVRDGTFVGCAAATSYAARAALKTIEGSAKWERKEHVAGSRLFAHLKATGSRPRIQNRGSIDAGLAAAAKRIRATYQVPFIAHVPMEPRAAVAEWENGKLTVWTGTQNPHGVRDQLAKAFQIQTSQVRVIVPDAGGGFGGKHTGEVAIEAARLAREAKKPVKVRWTRAEEFAWAYFRPAGLFEIEGGVDAKGRVTAWDFANYNAGTAALDTPYGVANVRTRFFYCESPLREGSYRGIAATANNFARECFMDELAQAAGMDPVEFRLANLENERLQNVLQAAAKSFGWKAGQKGIGVACGTEKGSYVAACAEVSQGKLQRMTMAFECGAILNPANLRSQVEGSLIQGLGGALFEEIEFAGGVLTNGRLQRYRVPRFRDVPRFEVVLVDRKDLAPAGAGETPIIAVAPAIANAIASATGTQVRSMPFRNWS